MVLKSKLRSRLIPLFYQLIRFGVIGTSAALVHFIIVVCLVEIGQLAPLTANVLGFLVAFQVSYWGHRHWTFRATTALHRVAMPRLLLVATSGLAANQAIFYAFLNGLHLPYRLALFFTLTILPVVTFVIGKCWVFR